MAMSTETVDIIREGVEGREALSDPERIRGIHRIAIEVEEGLRYRATRSGEARFATIVDEPTERGGSGMGDGPLTHFLIGAGSCLLNQYIRVAVAEGLDLTFTSMNVRGDARRDVGGGFEHIQQELFAEGTVSADAMERLAERAEGFCYVHNTLKNAVKLTTVVNLNGQEVVRRVSEPRALPLTHRG